MFNPGLLKSASRVWAHSGGPQDVWPVCNKVSTDRLFLVGWSPSQICANQGRAASGSLICVSFPCPIFSWTFCTAWKSSGDFNVCTTWGLSAGKLTGEASVLSFPLVAFGRLLGAQRKWPGRRTVEVFCLAFKASNL